ncbi:replicative DNA helicase [Mobiluncus mulieris]|uniref:Replicative DNA helicase n=1 Tax=Mobiluncus mulieris TaxID=2052 RepID=A0A2J9KND8_9ACTO|nr:replicative DNA helicase [Mobiluncus mulieris]EEJ53062.1 replicative DNA helicase [Mobiluncus mulieris ATCC 35243]EEZ90630.1 replicative DNA helicase [Mobiluncus mulieris 28-1]MCU9967877.1 replicative DNA helicase [Mobiluncus mulieris]MCU9973268.1 replicative DNA helicase [Mobiluncus mulieris]MCV0002403.1 replicative DNA helicase [Mobiluncus mulieris]
MSETTVLDRVPPHNLLAEQSVIGAMILSKNAIADVYQILQTTDFYETKHQVIFDTIMDLYSAGDSVDPLTLTSTLEKTGKLGQIGGLDYVYTLTHVVPTYANASYYAEIVRDKATLRGLVEAGTRITQLGWAFDEGDAKDLINTAHQELDRVSQRRTSEDYKALKDLIPQVTTEISNTEPDPNMVRTGFRDFDTEIQGLRPGQMIIVAARPGMGKSTFSLDICRYAAIHENKTAAIFSLEMSYAEIIKRLISAEASVPLSAINAGVSSADGTQSQAYWTNIANATNRMFEKPLYIDDSVNLTMPEIRAKCRRLKYNHDLSIAVVDYLQLMKGRGSAESRQQEVSEISRSLKLLAKELEIPIIAVAQLNRGPESRTDKKPMMSDLRESGSLEQDADMVLLLHRPEAYNPDDRPGEADLYVAKHRNGRTGTVHLTFQGALSRFVDAARVDPGGIPPQEEY